MCRFLWLQILRFLAAEQQSHRSAEWGHPRVMVESMDLHLDPTGFDPGSAAHGYAIGIP